MKQRILQLSDRRPLGDINVLVHLVRVVTQIAPEQTNGFVLSASPPTVADLLSQKKVAPGDTVRLAVSRSNNLLDLLRQLWSTPLVRVED